jgi:hypothetical protein
MGMATEEINNQDGLFRYLFSYASVPDGQRKIYQRIGSKIGKLSWTIPSNMPLNIPLIIDKENWDERKIDLYFTNFCLGNESKNTADIILHVQENLQDEYKQAFEQFHKCFDSELYISAILTLISLLEGCCQNLNSKKEVDIVQLINYRKKKANEKPEIDISPTLFCEISAIQNCLSKFYNSVNFEDILKVPLKNRHILVHGRNLKNITKIDCIKLLCCIDSVLNVDFFLSVQEVERT